MPNKNEEKIDFGDDSVPVYVTAVFIAFAGIGFLALSIYYIIYLPVPAAMQPLKTRLVVTLGLQEMTEVERLPVAVTVYGDENVFVYLEPNNDSEVIAIVVPDTSYAVLQKEGEWYRVEIEGEHGEGWINEQFLLLE